MMTRQLLCLIANCCIGRRIRRPLLGLPLRVQVCHEVWTLQQRADSRMVLRLLSVLPTAEDIPC